MSKVIIEVVNEAYSVDQIRRTMRVRDLKHLLESCNDEDAKIYLSLDHGYTYGSLRASMFEEVEDYKE